MVAKWCGLILVGILLLVPAAGALSPNIEIWSENDWVVAGDGGGSPLLLNVTEGGIPLAGAEVFLSCDPEMGSIAPSAVTTGADGTAMATFTPATESGVVTITAEFSDENGTQVSESMDLWIYPAAPAAISYLSYPDEGRVGSVVDIALKLSDRWGNPVDNIRGAENVTFSVGSAGDGAVFIIDSGDAASVSLPVGSDGLVTATLRLDTIAGENIVMISPSGKIGVGYLTITGVANGTPASIESTYASASCRADGGSTVLIAYTLYDEYGNPCNGAPVRITSSLGETASVLTNSYGSVLVRYGEKTTSMDVTIWATAVENASVSVADIFSFTSIYPNNLVLAASPLNMKSGDVDPSFTAKIRAWVTDESGAVVTTTPVPVTFEITGVNVHGFNQTTGPHFAGGASSIVQNTGSNGVAEVSFWPGAFDTAEDATGTCTVTATATMNCASIARNVDLIWRNYPSVSAAVSASPSTVLLDNETDVTISLTGDGWEFSPAPADVVVCTSRTPTMLRGYPDPMAVTMRASKYFADLMEEGTDSIGLVSFGMVTPDGMDADLTELDNSAKKWVGGDQGGYGPNNDDASYIAGNYFMNDLVRFNENVTLDCSLNSTFTGFDDAVERLIPYAPGSWGLVKQSGDEFALALKTSIDQLTEKNSSNLKSVVVFIDDDWNKGKDSEQWEAMADYANNAGVKIFVVLVDTPKSKSESTNDHTSLESELQYLASETGGQFWKITDEDQYASTMERLNILVHEGLREAAIINTTLDASLAHVTVDDDSSVAGGDVLHYQYVDGVSTRIVNQTWASTTVDDSADWTDRVLDYDIGTMEYGQTWTATLRLALSQTGTIGLFTDGASKIRYSSAAGTAYEQDLPPVYVTVVSEETTDVFGTSTLSIPTLSARGDNDTRTIAVNWTLDYTGTHPDSVRQKAQYQYSSDNIVWDNLWHDFDAVPAVEGAVSGIYGAKLNTNGKNGYYRIRIHAWEAISSGADAWRTTLEPCMVGGGVGIKIRLV